MNRTATIIHDGTGQDGRMPRALYRDYFRPDEMALPELLFLGSRFASQLAYFGASNQATGDWRSLFAGDASAILGDILVETARPEPWQRMFATFLAQMQAFLMNLAGCPQPDAVPVYLLDKLIRCWAVDCRNSAEPAAHRMSQTLEGLIATHLEPALGALAAYLARHDKRHWKFLSQNSRVNAAGDTGIQTPPPGASFIVVAQFLTDTFGAYINALAVIRKVAEDQFPLSLPTGQHEPAVGLYLAFAQLYLKTKNSIDDFSQRQLRLYYERVLRFRRQAVQADSAYLVLVSDGTVAEAPVRAGTPFIGGEDADGVARLYVSAKEIRVTDARIAALSTLYFDRDPLHSPEKDLGYATSAKTTSIPVASDNDHYPLFGAKKKRGDTTRGKDARLGFAIVSPVLLLREGTRDIVIDLHFEAGPENIDWLIKRLRAIIGGASNEGAFFKAFAGAFRIRLTTTEGWRDVPAYVPGCHLVDSDVAKDCLRIAIGLPENFPPVVAHDPKLHAEENYGGDGAVISFLIEPDAYLYPYDFLSRQILRGADIKVRVRGCRDLALYNNYGQLNAAAPFAPFGPLPKVGSHLVIGSREAFAKQLTALELTVGWDGLPAAGLENHYRAYEADISTASFRVALNALRDRAWLPEKSAECIVQPLFCSDDSERTRFDCAQLLPYLCIGDLTDGDYNQHARGGFIRLALVAPALAFGHAEYPQLLAKALTRNSRLDALGPARRILGGKSMLPIPETPYTPQIASITLDYAAQARISPHLASSGSTRERFYHLHPFGIEAISLSTHGQTPLLPTVEQRANLYLGIEASELGGALNLYFHLRNDSDIDTGVPAPTFNWSFLDGNRWVPLEDYRLLSDTTRGFLVSGVVQLDLPRGMARGDTQMANGHYWLRVATDGAASALCSVYAVHTHGLRVNRVADKKTPPDLAILRAGSIQSAKIALPGIATILQPADAFGGQPEESEDAMIMRAHERLRHRQRAVSPWDYERLVLQRFPNLHKVKCFSNTCFTSDASMCRRPGNVLIVVVPPLHNARDVGEGLKENVLLLRDIKAYLETLASPFVKIDVRNPVYERIQVRCAARFRGTGNDGLLLQQLNRDICEFISPWNPQGNTANFGWSLRAQEIQGYLHSLSYVQSVWGLSLLRVVDHGNDHYVLTDTAAAGRHGSAELAPVYPWSLAVPFRHHLIETDETCLSDPRGPWRTGISHLRVGTTFIVSGNRNGEKE
jgi:hypothetical protein